MIDVLIVDDLKSARNMIRDVLASDADIHVCGTAEKGEDAVKMVSSLRPDLIIMDSYLKGTSGYRVAETIMQVRPTPIIMVMASSESLEEVPGRAFGSGVLEVIIKADLYRWRTQPDVAARFIRKVKLLSKVSHDAIKRHRNATQSRLRMPHTVHGFAKDKPMTEKDGSKIIAMVSSTGGPNALLTILHALPSDFPAPILIVQHMSPGFIHGLAEWLNHEDHIRVHVAEDNDALRPGEALLAPDDAHLTVSGDQCIRLDRTPPLGGHRPAGDALLKSIGPCYAKHSLGIILTGMGNDGARGMAALKAAGGRTIAQDKATSIIFGMPKTAIDLGVIDQVLPLSQIAPAMERFVRGDLWAF